jgi:SAM-dependent methyltransferase
VHWLVLAAVPSSLMLSVTTYLSTDIASVPLLWILPLTGYLLSFVLAFGPWSTWGRSLPAKLAPPLICALAIFLVQNAGLPLILSIALHLAAFFIIAAALHIELANRRPPVRHLTEFYFWLSAGGVVGGSFTAIVAPAAFNTVAEYPIALIVACLLLPPPEDTPARAPAMATPVLIGVLVWAGVAWSTAVDLDPRLRIALLMPQSVWTLSLSRHRLPFTLALACWFVAGEAARDRAGLLVQQRSFFGVYLVEAARGSHRLWHGTTLHGEQRVDARPPVPLTYYHPTGPIGQAVTAILGDRPSARVAAVGLGAGSLAAYVRESQEWTFYEIDPLVEDIARNPALFGYLDGCGDRCRVVLGDARLSLARATGERFDLIVLDAFSSDAIPVHLMTREALDLYLSRLAPGGVLAFHISNRHLALGPVLGALFADRGLVGLAQLHVVATPDPEGRSTSEWLVAARHAGELRSLSFDARWTPTRAAPGSRVWTDQFSDVVSVLRGFP